MRKVQLMQVFNPGHLYFALDFLSRTSFGPTLKHGLTLSLCTKILKDVSFHTPEPQLPLAVMDVVTSLYLIGKSLTQIC